MNLELYNLLLTQWNGNEKMANYCYKSSVYVQSGDSYINVCSRPGIDSDMWYDDETDGPGETFAAFRAYNMRSNAPIELLDNQKFVTINYTQDRTDGKLLSITIHTDYGNPRPMTDEEVKLTNEALSLARADYEKRLATYWKRYSNKVHARGYFVNR
jgi:hypothetical protein